MAQLRHAVEHFKTEQALSESAAKVAFWKLFIGSNE